MGLDEKKLSYHGAVSNLQKALEFARAFNAGISIEGRADPYFDIEINMGVLSIYPSGFGNISGVRLPKDAKDIDATSKMVCYSDDEDRRYAVHFTQRVDIPTQVAMEVAQRASGKK